jgi:hypothetical protein
MLPSARNRGPWICHLLIPQDHNRHLIVGAPFLIEGAWAAVEAVGSNGAVGVWAVAEGEVNLEDSDQVDEDPTISIAPIGMVPLPPPPFDPWRAPGSLDLIQDHRLAILG